MISRLAMSCALAALLVASAHASLLTPAQWGMPVTVDAQGDQLPSVLNTAQDIREIYWDWDGGTSTHYFRMDLTAEPTTGADNSAEIYGLYFNTGPGGGDNSWADYIPTELSGIDYIVDMHFDTALGWMASHFHTWTGAAFNTVAFAGGDIFQGAYDPLGTVDDRYSLEWRTDDLPYNACFTGASYSRIPAPDPDRTHDLTDTACTPEPGTLALFGAGFLAAVVAVRRRRAAA